MLNIFRKLRRHGGQLYHAIHSGSRARTQGGFSLVESIIAMAIISLTGLMLVTTLGTSIKSSVLNDNHSKAESLARAQIEYIESQPYDSSNNYLTLDIPANCSGFSYGTPTVTTVSSGLQKISVTVTYDTTAFTLASYKANK